jgi:hypothetical protein
MGVNLGMTGVRGKHENRNTKSERQGKETGDRRHETEEENTKIEIRKTREGDGRRRVDVVDSGQIQKPGM